MTPPKPFTEMTNDEFDEFVVRVMLDGWVPLKEWRRLFPLETQRAVDVRIARGFWKRGVHVSQPKGGGTWVNVKAIREWITSGEAAIAEPEGGEQATVAGL